MVVVEQLRRHWVCYIPGEAVYCIESSYKWYICSCRYVQGLQQEDGSFWGDKWGEVDNRWAGGQGITYNCTVC